MRTIKESCPIDYFQGPPPPPPPKLKTPEPPPKEPTPSPSPPPPPPTPLPEFVTQFFGDDWFGQYFPNCTSHVSIIEN